MKRSQEGRRYRGGNSAGQAAVFLSQHARQVLLLIRGDDLNKNMSSYLVRRIEQTPNIELLRNTTIQRTDGDGHLASVEIVDSQTGQRRTVETPAVFSSWYSPATCAPAPSSAWRRQWVKAPWRFNSCMSV